MCPPCHRSNPFALVLTKLRPWIFQCISQQQQSIPEQEALTLWSLLVFCMVPYYQCRGSGLGSHDTWKPLYFISKGSSEYNIITEQTRYIILGSLLLLRTRYMSSRLPRLADIILSSLMRTEHTLGWWTKGQNRLKLARSGNIQSQTNLSLLFINKRASIALR